MKHKLGIYTSNVINKYGYRFSIESIEKSLLETWDSGRPMFISHDYHRLLGWSNPLGLYIAPPEVRLYGISSFFETEEEKKAMQKNVNDFFKQINDIENNDKNKLENCLKGFLSGNEIYMKRECTCVIDENIVSKVLPDKVIDEKDKRSLISINDLEIIAPGVFEIEGYTVFAHRYFRRSLSQLNNLNDIFLKKLLALKNNSEVDVKIAIDPHTIGLKNSYRESMELEYWWGPKFNDSLLDIPEGVTHYKASEEQKYFHGVSGTQFWWHKQNNIQSLECEEIRDLPSLGISDDKYACRYVHSMIDEKTGLANHLDGAVRIYDEESFLRRLDVDISKAGKNTEYVKLWRIDGEINISLWKELLNDFYRDNRQVGEYLLGNTLQKNRDENIDEDTHLVTLLDYMPKDQGYHIFLSYHNKEEFSNKSEIEVIQDIVEYSAIDLLKLIKRDTKTSLHIKDTTEYIAFEDMDINFPLIMHRGTNAIALANKTMEHLYRLCEQFYINKDDRIITIGIGIEYENKVAFFSFVSHIESLYFSYHKEPIVFPILENIGEWCSKQNNFLSTNYDIQKFSDSFLHKQGYFYINRYFINDLIVPNEDGKTFSLKVKEDKKVLAEAVVNNLAFVSTVNKINKAICSNCNKDYTKCNCSVFLNKSYSIKVEKAQTYGFILSRKNNNT